jgi:chaperone required for assembly of F1-ATPase
MINPGTMPLTRLANVALDRVAAEMDAVATEIAKYAGSDLLCYRAGEPAAFAAKQAAAWDPVLDWARERLRARFVCSEGVRHVAQPAEAIAAVRAEIAEARSPFALSALASATALTGSALLALALARGRLSADAAWEVAHVDEDWNIAQWGEDAPRGVRRGGEGAGAGAVAARRVRVLAPRQPNFRNSFAYAGLIFVSAARAPATSFVRAAACMSATACWSAFSIGA